MRIVSWNINSVRLRIDLVERLARELAPDVLCLQETKCADDVFPLKAIRAMGFEHIAIHGQKGYHGVAILSRLPLADAQKRSFCDNPDARHISAAIEGAGGRTFRLHNFYLPAGGDEPDPATNPKFDHKLRFLDEMQGWFRDGGPDLHGPDGAIMLGDLNIAPLPEDVWSHKQLLKVVSHTPVETEALDRALDMGAWTDVVRQHTPPPDRLFSWWSYRAMDWSAADRGRRLDHIWGTRDLASRCVSAEILRDARGWERPSDHAPVIADFDF